MHLAVAPAEPSQTAAAEALAARLELPLVEPETAAVEMLLLLGRERLELRERGPQAAGPLVVTFRKLPGRPPLLRAVGAGATPAPRVIDATAGLGQDAFVLAQAGLSVVLVERSPVVAALLEDGLRRARLDPELSSIASRLELQQGDARERLAGLAPAEVVYLDPMYPERGGRARKGKGMRLFRALLGDDLDADGLLEPARRAALKRVVVKRPRRAPPLAGVAPSGSLSGTTTRFDLYAPLP